MSFIKTNIVLAILVSSSFCFEQTSYVKGTITDQRDGKSYKTIQIGNKIWMVENMKYQTQNSEHHKIYTDGQATDEYFYPFKEIQQVCPEQFRIPKTSDWVESFESLVESGDLPSFELVEGKAKKDGVYVNFNFSDTELDLFHELRLLNLKPKGHTQGGRLVGKGSMNVWVEHNGSLDPKFHIHMLKDIFYVHVHDHHLIGRRKTKLPKFSVRCVCDVAAD